MLGICHNAAMGSGSIKLEQVGKTPAPSRLGPVPEFGRNGESPPLRAEPVIVSSALLTFRFGQSLAEASRTPLTERELLERLEESPSNKFWQGLGNLRDENELWDSLPDAWDSVPDSWHSTDFRATKRLVYRQYWKRDDPVIQLVPGETQTYSVQLKSGLTDQVLREFSSSLGLGAKISAVELSAQLSGRLNRTVTVSTELQTTRTKQLTNNRDGYYRRVAVWHVVHSISLYDLNAPLGMPVIPFRHWFQIQNVEFADTAAPQSSSFDVGIP